MKQQLQIVWILLASLSLTACEKIIDIKLSDADKKYVIEGVITDHDGRTQVKISQTKNYSSTNDFEGISGATVRITEEGGNATQLAETSAGVYVADVKGVPGKRYILHVDIDGKEFRAVSQMPQPVNIDSIYTAEMDMGSTPEKYVNVLFNDPAETKNYYRFVYHINGIKVKRIFTRNDDLSDGRLTSASLFSDDREIAVGDTIKVELQSIDTDVYAYWYSLHRGADGSPSASPANPVTNLSGGTLGYFSAHTVNEKTIVVR